jgi:hypothetical protein
MNADTDSPKPNRRSIAEAVLIWWDRVRYVAFSGVMHFILVVVLGGTVLYKQHVEPPDFTSTDGGLMIDDLPPPEPQDTLQIQNPDLSQAATSAGAVAAAATATAATASTQVSAITTTGPSTSNFTMAVATAPNISLDPAQVAPSVAQATPVVGVGLSKGQASRIAAFTGGWSRGGRAAMGQPLKSRAFDFTAYLAKYAGGDWDSTVWLDGDHVRGGSLHNLLYIMSRMSHKKIHANPQPVPLDLSSDEIFQKKPPFIWFTGHRDFVLTDVEVLNLGEYLRSGGCIWGDSSLPGHRSRFDIAFRREMLRLLPEVNSKWEPLPANHPIYTNTYYQEIKGVVPGMNFYSEPIYGLKGFAGELAVIYTANDYGDMWQFGIDENGDFDLSRDEKRRFVAINEPMWHRRNIYFRNIEPKALMDTYKFGTNIIIHLLTRWETHTRFAPIMSKNP